MTAFIWNNLSVNRMAHTVRKPKIHFSVPKGLEKLVSKSSELYFERVPKGLAKITEFLLRRSADILSLNAQFSQKRTREPC